MGASTDIERSGRAPSDFLRALRGAAVPSTATGCLAIAHSQAMEEQLRPLAHKGGQCAPESDPLESQT